MLEIPHVTKANFEKYGSRLLEITMAHGAEKLGKLVDFTKFIDFPRISRPLLGFTDSTGFLLGFIEFY